MNPWGFLIGACFAVRINSLLTLLSLTARCKHVALALHNIVGPPKKLGSCQFAHEITNLPA